MFAAPTTGRPADAPNPANAKVLLGRRRGLRPTRPQHEFAFDAQEFGDAPALLVAFGSRQRLVDYREPFGSLIVTTEGVRNLGEKWGVKEGKRVPRDAGERGAQELQPGANVAALDEQHASEPACRLEACDTAPALW
jgi:hypothetical protein